MKTLTRMRRITSDHKRSSASRWLTNSRKLDRKYKGQLRNA